MKVVLAEQIFIPDIFLPDKLYKFLKSKLVFLNPKFYELERRGYSTWKTPRFIKAIKIIDDGILVPTGFLKEIKQFISDNNLELTIEDHRVIRKKLSFSSTLKLKTNQQKIAKKLIKHDRAILEAKPGFGKTMVGLYIMKRHRQPTLIIVHTKTLLHQWLKRIEKWFNFEKNDVGIIGDNKWKGA